MAYLPLASPQLTQPAAQRLYLHNQQTQSRLPVKKNISCLMKCFEQINQRLKKPIWSDYENKYISSVLLPCGKCPACIERKIMEWSFRLDQERKDSECCYFVTLTYDNEHLPLNDYGRMTLNKEHLKGYFKLLKQSKSRSIKKNNEYGIWEQHYYGSDLKNSKIKYYAVGEYGSKKKATLSRNYI